MFHRVCPLFQPLYLPFCALMTVVPNRSGIHPLVEGSGRQVHPKTTTFCLVLGFTPSRQPYRAYQSQNDLEQRYSSPSVRFVWHFPAPFRRLRFPRCVTSGRESAFHALSAPDLSHQDEKRHSTHFQLLMCDIRKSLTASVSKK